MAEKVVEELYVDFHPYVMWTCGFPVGDVWKDTINDRTYPVQLRPNALGFASDIDYQAIPTPEYLDAHGKKPGERIVLVTGGSAMHGVGASTNAQTIAGWMERVLNESQDTWRYRVLNMGMGSWVAYQQSIGLDLWGSVFDPDWVVVMDGVNDAASYLNASAGIGNPMFWPNMLYLLRGGKLRSPLADFLTERSAFFRKLTGARTEQNKLGELTIDHNAQDPRFIVHIPNTVGGLREQLAFYVQSQRSILRKFDGARYLLATQPWFDLMRDRHDDFPTHWAAFAATDPHEQQRARERLNEDLARWMVEYADRVTPTDNRGVLNGIKWFLASAALEVEALAAEMRASGRRDVRYVNLDAALPFEQEARRINFMDHTHLTNEGHEMAGRFFARQILDADRRSAVVRPSWPQRSRSATDHRTSHACPYVSISDEARWAVAVAGRPIANIQPFPEKVFAIDKTTRIASAGSCFAQNIARRLLARGYNYIITEQAPEGMTEGEARAVNYGVYPARFANIYTALQLVQLFDRAYGDFEPQERPWSYKNGFVDPFRPHIQPQPFASIEVLEADRAIQFEATRRMFETLDVFVFTLGLTEAWRSRSDGAVFPVCPGCSRGEYDPAKYEFVNFTVEDVSEHLNEFRDRLKRVNQRAKIILTVSPVPLIATKENRHVLLSTTYSKSVLRVAAQQFVNAHEDATYFGAYEIVSNTFNTHRYFLNDRRTVSEHGVAHVMSTFFAAFAGEEPEAVCHEVESSANSKENDTQDAASDAQKIAVICDEEISYKEAIEEGNVEKFGVFTREYYINNMIHLFASRHARENLKENWLYYKNFLDKHHAGAFKIYDDIEAWAEPLKRIAASRPVVASCGGSHSTWCTSWPFYTAADLDRRAGSPVIVSCGVHGGTTINSIRMLSVIAGVFDVLNIPLKGFVSMEGANEALYRYISFHQFLVSGGRHPYRFSAESELLSSLNWTPSVAPEASEHVSDLCLIKHPDDAMATLKLLPVWEEETVSRILLFSNALIEKASTLGVPLLSVLQPTALKSRSHERRAALRTAWEDSPREADFLSWRRAVGKAIHGGEYQIVKGQGNVEYDMDGVLLALSHRWERDCSTTAHRVDLSRLSRASGTKEEQPFFADDMFHYAEHGTRLIGQAVAKELTTRLSFG